MLIIIIIGADIKDYKASAVSRFTKGCQNQQGSKTDSVDSTTMKVIKFLWIFIYYKYYVILGGMLHDEEKKGIRRKSLPEPNPTQIDIDEDATLLSLCKEALELYYKEYANISVSDIKVADSSGNVLDCDLSQKVSLFYSSNGILPSRHKFYTVLDISKVWSIMN